jgi:acetyl esterase/lipase
VQNNKRQVVLCQITPKEELLSCNKAYVFAHQGGGLMFDMEMFLLEGFRTAVLFKTPVFFVDYWKDNIKAPMGSKDFADVIEFINNNSIKYGIQKDHITVGGAGAGGWIVLGALHELIARKNEKIVETAFLISPIVDEKLSKLEPQHLAFWEEKWVNYNKGFFQLMATDYQK